MWIYVKKNYLWKSESQSMVQHHPEQQSKIPNNPNEPNRVIVLNLSWMRQIYHLLE